jgi:hypothetical protein
MRYKAGDTVVLNENLEQYCGIKLSVITEINDGCYKLESGQWGWFTDQDFIHPPLKKGDAFIDKTCRGMWICESISHGVSYWVINRILGDIKDTMCVSYGFEDSIELITGNSVTEGGMIDDGIDSHVANNTNATNTYIPTKPSLPGTWVHNDSTYESIVGLCEENKLETEPTYPEDWKTKTNQGDFSPNSKPEFASIELNKSQLRKIKKL